jgi:hypothetical protein
MTTLAARLEAGLLERSARDPDSLLASRRASPPPASGGRYKAIEGVKRETSGPVLRVANVSVLRA